MTVAITETWKGEKPKNRTIKVVLDTGDIVVSVKYKMDKVDAKVKVYGQYVRLSDKSIMTVPVPVQATVVEVKMPDGTSLKARSCCKAPDVFNSQQGVYLALKRLFEKDSLVPADRVLTKEMRSEIFKTVCPFLVKS